MATLIWFPFVPTPIVETLSIDNLIMSNQDENDTDNANATKTCHDRLKWIVNSSYFRESDATEGTNQESSIFLIFVNKRAQHDNRRSSRFFKRRSDSIRLALQWKSHHGHWFLRNTAWGRKNKHQQKQHDVKWFAWKDHDFLFLIHMWWFGSC